MAGEQLPCLLLVLLDRLTLLADVLSAVTIGVKIGAMKVYSDSQGAIKLLKHPIASIKSKHIDVIHHFARERVSRKEVMFEYCNTDAMIADCFTKALPVGKFRWCCAGMGVL